MVTRMSLTKTKLILIKDIILFFKLMNKGLLTLDKPYHYFKVFLGIILFIKVYLTTNI